MTSESTALVAIVGMACRFSSAPNLHAFWDLLISGRDGVIEYPIGRTPELDIFYGSAGGEMGAPTRRGGFLPDIESFDAEFFRISAREAALMDPQQRLLLELAWEALEDAGQPLERIAGPRTGVFIGAWAGDYGRQLDAMQAVADVQSTVFNSLFGVSSRLAFTFDFRGPEISVNGGCASSLIALHQAMAALRAGECDVALVGGVNAIVRPEITQALARAGVLSADGTCKFGDASADGYVRGEGGGLLVLKRLNQALADGDRIRAVIRGSAINNSGLSSGFVTRPSQTAQSDVILAALSDARLSPVQIQYIEAHGTGTAAGDGIELAALAAAIGRDHRIEPCLVGSTKGNIGHTEAAAGIASIIKTVLALEHRVLPPTLHVDELNPVIDWANAGIALNRNTRSWPKGDTRRAGVSSFALGGTNAHVVLEEAPPPTAGSPAYERPMWPLPLSANSREALRTMAAAYAEMLERRSDLSDIGFTAATRRSALPYRLVAVGADTVELANNLRSWLAQEHTPFVIHGPRVDEPNDGVVLVFPGQGSQWLGMGRELAASEPAFHAALARCDAAIQAEAGWSVRALLAADTDWENTGIEKIQPALFSMQIALAALWSSWGIKPTVLIGHSMGEVAAACVAGALSLEDAVSVICRRSLLMTRLAGQGEMALVELSLADAEEALRGYEDRLSIAVSNGPRSTVISGEPISLGSVLERLQSAGIFCRPVAVQVAAHSPQMDVIREDLLKTLADLRPRAGHTPIYSTTLGRITDGAEFDAQYWVSNLRRPVLFHNALNALIAEGRGIFIEVSPHPVLLPAIEESGREAGAELLALASIRRDEPEQTTMLGTLGSLFAHGVVVDWAGIYSSGRVVEVPGHPWQRHRYWPDSDTAARVAVAAMGHPLLPPPFTTADRSWIWNCRLGLEILPWLKDHAVRGATLLPATAFIEMAATAAKQILGHARVVVEALQLKEAIVLSPSREHVVQIAATSERPGHWSMKFYAHDDTSDAWTVAATASVRADDVTTSSLDTADLEEFRRGKPARATSGDTHAAWLKRLGYDFGRDFLNLQWLDIDRDVVRAAARTDDALKTTSYTLHPALLDSALQALVLGLSQHRPQDELFIPRFVGQSRLYPAAAGARAAYIRAEPSKSDRRCLSGDVRLYGDDGTLLAELLGLEFQALGATAGQSEPLYDLEWVVRDRKTHTPNMPDTWFVISDQQGVGEAFALEIRQQVDAVEVIEVHADQRSSLVGTLEKALIAEDKVADTRIGVVHFLTVDLSDDASVNQIAENAAGIAAIAAMLAERGSANLWLVTRGACAAVSAEHVAVPQASVWGLGAVIANECPSLACRMIDLGSSEPNERSNLVQEVLSGQLEPRVALRNKERRVARLRARADAATSRIRRPLRDGECAALSVARIGVLDTLAPVLGRRRAPSAGEVEIEVHATGLNFLDVMRAMGLFDPSANQHPTLGIECAGTVVRIGSDVREFNVGDRVVALTPAFLEVGTLASHLVTHALLVAKIPANMGITEAAGLPCAYLTAYFALVEAARMRAGETVLIHSATGGVGVAAIQVARWIGAKIIASAGNEAKRAMLRDMGIDAVFDSRSAAFAERIAELTAGRGVDVILNSLSGAAISEGLAALAPYGRFLEIGKRDMWENSRIGFGSLLMNRSIFGIDIAAMIEDQPERVGAMLRTVVQMVGDGILAPLPTSVFVPERAAEALQLMAAAGHTGKVVIETIALEVADDATAMPIRSDGTYLITGGLGALGLVAAEELVQAGACNLVLCGRAAPPAAALQTIATLRAKGAHIIHRSVDVGDEMQLRDLFAEVGATMPPLRGVVHAAGILDDALVDQLSAERFTHVMRGKVEGARLLDRLTAPLTLDFFVLFSSVAALLGSPGQGNYAAGNAMLDALAAERRARGQPALSIAWGPWAEVGLAAAQANRGARIATQGLKSLLPAEGGRLFSQLLGIAAPYAAAMHFDAVAWLDVAGPSAAALFADLLSDRQGLAVSPHMQRQTTFSDPKALKELVMNQLAAVLRMPTDRLDGERPFRSLGLDSLMGLELRNRLERALGVKLSASTVWNYPTADQLWAHLAAQLAVKPAVPPAATQQSAAQALENELLEAQALLADL